MDREFRVVLSSRSTLKAVSRRTWHGANYEVRLRDDISELGPRDGHSHVGLIYVVDLKAADSETALVAACRLCRRITDELSLLHRSAIEVPTPQFALEWQPAATDREFAQVLYNVPVVHDPRREFQHTLYETFFQRIDAARPASPKLYLRLERAMHFLRSSQLDSDVIDKFEDVCEALEALEPRLRGKYGTSTKRPCRCATCKEDLRCQACSAEALCENKRSGIDAFMTKVLGVDPKTAKQLRDKRNDLVHSRVPLEVLANGLDQMVEVARRTAHEGILDLLGYDSAERFRLTGDYLPLGVPPRLIAKAILHGLGRDGILANGRYPQIKLRGIEVIQPSVSGVASQEIKPIGLQLHIGMENCSADWRAAGAVWWTGVGGGPAIEGVQLLVASRKESD